MELGDDQDVRIWELMVVGLVFGRYDEGLLGVGSKEFSWNELGGCIFELEFSADKEHEPKCDVIALSDEASD